MAINWTEFENEAVYGRKAPIWSRIDTEPLKNAGAEFLNRTAAFRHYPFGAKIREMAIAGG